MSGSATTIMVELIGASMVASATAARTAHSGCPAVESSGCDATGVTTSLAPRPVARLAICPLLRALLCFLYHARPWSRRMIGIVRAPHLCPARNEHQDWTPIWDDS